MASIAKLKLLAIGGLGAGTISTFFAVMTPTTFEPNALANKSQQTTQLNADTADSWTSIPGPDNYIVTWQHTLYNLTNPDAVSKTCFNLYR